MRLNGLRAPDETTLVPLSAVDVNSTEKKKESNQRGYCFHSGRYGHFKAQCRKLKKGRYCETRAKNRDINSADPQRPKCETCRKIHKPEKCWDGANAANDIRERESLQSRPTKSVNTLYQTRLLSQKSEIAAPTFRGKSRRDGVHNRNSHQIDSKKTS